MKRLLNLFSLSLLAMCLAAISGCGGGSTVAGGVGSGGSGVVYVTMAEGSITGFGSVIVDGTEYDDSNATAQADDGTGTLRNTELKIGQRVRLQLDSGGKVQTVNVLAQLAGPITAAPDTNGNLRVLGQWVRLSGSATDAGRGVTAQVAGFVGTTPQLGDEVEVHGSWIFDAAANRYVLLANRLEKLSNVTSAVQLSGVVTSVSGTTLALNATTGFSVTGAVVPTSVGVGSLVRVWASREAWNAHSTAPAAALQVTRVIDGGVLSANAASDEKVRLAGPIANFDAATRTVEIAGVRVSLPPSINVDDALLAPGQILSLEVQRKGNELVVDAAVPRGVAGSATDLGQTLKTQAIVSGVAWSASPVQFTLRGVKWVAAQSTIANGCRSAKSTDDVLVIARGKSLASGDTVLATDVQCVALTTSTPPSATTIERNGRVASLEVGAQRFVLQSSKGDITVTWDSQTYFENEFSQHPESLTGQSVEVEGVTTTGSLRARKVKRSN